MAVTTETFWTLRDDRLQVTLFAHADEEPTILLTVTDHDDSLVPTAEFTLGEAGEFRDLLRKLCEQGQRYASTQRS
jgi:hypothetical protein